MSNTSISVFTNSEFGELRAVATNDTPEILASDVARILEYPETNKLTRLLDDDEKGHHKVATLGGMQTMTTLNEAGFYRAVMLRRASCIKDPAARERVKRFQRWVTHEVLPSIRRSGGYIATNGTETNEELLARAVLVAQDAIKRKDEQIAELEPKARFADAVAASDGTCLVGELAKMLRQEGVEIGQNRLFEWMRKGGYLGNSGSNRNVPTQRAMEQGLFRIKETVITHADGHTSINRTPKITGKGQTYFIRRFLSDEEHAQAY